jgi:hypothetical protein
LGITGGRLPLGSVKELPASACPREQDEAGQQEQDKELPETGFGSHNDRLFSTPQILVEGKRAENTLFYITNGVDPTPLRRSVIGRDGFPRHFPGYPKILRNTIPSQRKIVYTWKDIKTSAGLDTHELVPG